MGVAQGEDPAHPAALAFDKFGSAVNNETNMNLVEPATTKTGASFNRHNSTQEVATPWDFIRALEPLFGSKFQMDLAASAENAKAPLYFTKEQDSLKQEWPTNLLCWLNPEYSDIAPWAEKCAMSHAQVIMLTPASVGTKWFLEWIHNRAWVLFVRGRITFVGHTAPYPKDLMLSCFNLRARKPGYNVIDPWKGHLV